MQSFQFIDGRCDKLDPADRGLAYGDGLFETMLSRDGRIRWLDYHLDRLATGCARLGIPSPPREEIRRTVLAGLPIDRAAIVKLILTRGSGPRGYAPPRQPVVTLLKFVDEIAAQSEPPPVTAAILQLRLSESEILAGIKHLCRLEQVLGRLELQQRGFEEGILLSRSGIVVGCTSANIFIVKDSSIVTPRICLAGVAGVMRRVVLEAGRAAGISIEETDIQPEALQSADELFLTNAIIGVRRIAALEDRRFASHAMVDRIRAVLERASNA